MEPIAEQDEQSSVHKRRRRKRCCPVQLSLQCNISTTLGPPHLTSRICHNNDHHYEDDKHRQQDCLAATVSQVAREYSSSFHPLINSSATADSRVEPLATDRKQRHHIRLDNSRQVSSSQTVPISSSSSKWLTKMASSPSSSFGQTEEIGRGQARVLSRALSSRSGPRLCTVGLSILTLTMMQLICDNWPAVHHRHQYNHQSSSRAAAPLPGGLVYALPAAQANSDLDATDVTGSEPSLVIGSTELGSSESENKQRFLLEPHDTYAIVGQREATLSCVVQGKAGSLFWYQGDFIITNERRLSKWSNQERYSVSVRHLSLNELLIIRKQQQQQRNSSDESAPILTSLSQLHGQEASNGTTGSLVSSKLLSTGMPTSGPDGGVDLGSDQQLDDQLATGLHNKEGDDTRFNGDQSAGVMYTLHIRNVQLQDDESYYCRVAASSEPHQAITTRIARLHVLQPPTKLDIQMLPQEPPQHHSQQQETERSADESGDNQLDAAAQATTIEVRQNTRVRLECRSNQAKPRAELLWLDENQKPVPRLSSLRTQTVDDSASNETLSSLMVPYVEDFVREQGDEGLEVSWLVLSFDAKLEQHNKSLTCVARHKALSLMAASSSGGVNSNTDQLSYQASSDSFERAVRLSVLYEPIIELTKEPMQALEFGPVKFTCNAHARPSAIKYSWFIDDQPVDNATEPELFVSRLTRQLHLREIRCQANNAVGATSNLTRLAVKYSPAYVTHLLPASLQPDTHHNHRNAHHHGSHHHHHHHHHDGHYHEDISSVVAGRNSYQRHQQQQRRPSHAALLPNQQQVTSEPVAAATDNDGAEAATPTRENHFGHLFEQLDAAISGELALGAHPGANVALRCDFDSNPRPERIEWFKISTEYGSMRDVTPKEADELIAFGANHALFVPNYDPLEDSYSTTLDPLDNHNNSNSISLQQDQRDHSKRHISIDQSPGGSGSSGGGGGGLSSWPDGTGGGGDEDEEQQQETPTEAALQQQQAFNLYQAQELDFEQMSSELLIEMGLLEEQQRRLRKLAANGSSAASEPAGALMLPLIEQISSEPPSHTIVKIHEPLDFELSLSRPLIAKLRDYSSASGAGKSSSSLRKLDASQQQQREYSTGSRLNAAYASGLLQSGASASDLILLPSGLRTTNYQLSTGFGARARNVSAQWLASRRLAMNQRAHFRRRLDARQAQVTSSSIALKSVNGDSIGRYVCKAIGQPGFKSMAKSIYFVLKQNPRIISVGEQWAPLGAPQMQAECLAQINTVQDNQTQVLWFRDGKPIDIMSKLTNSLVANKNITIIEELSPDGLFIRSTLRINGADFNDFGKYNCTVLNSVGKDTMVINLQPSAPTGFAFKLLAALTIGSIVLFLAIILLIFAIDPCKRFDNSIIMARKSSPAAAKTLVDAATKKLSGLTVAGGQLQPNQASNINKLAASNGNVHGNRTASLSSSQSFGGSSTAKRSTNSPMDEQKSNQLSASCEHSDDHTDAGYANGPNRQHNQRSLTSSENNNQNHNNNHLHHLHQRPGSAFSTASHVAFNAVHAAQYPAYAPQRNFNNTFTSSLSSSASFRNQLHRHHQQQQQNLYQSNAQLARTCSFRSPSAIHSIGSHKFAAIHESLEHKLQFQHPAGPIERDNQNELALMNRHQDQLQHQNDLNAGLAGAAAAHSGEADGNSHVDENSLDKSKGANNSGGAGASGRSSFIDKIWSKFQRPDSEQRKSRHWRGSHTGKSARPTISEPMTNGTTLKRSALSNSLTLLNGTTVGGAGDSLAAQQQALGGSGGGGKHLMMMHLNHISGGAESQLVSSSANLIHDSTTASDGTTSSGRSSSTSNGNHMMCKQQQQAGNQVGAMVWSQQQQQAMLPNGQCAIVYQNGASPYELHHQQQHQQQIYANDQTHYALGPQFVAPNCAIWTSNGQAAIMEQQQQQQQQVDPYQLAEPQQVAVTNGHYQMPVLMSEPYLAAAVAQVVAAQQQQQHQADQLERSSYATICNGVSAHSQTGHQNGTTAKLLMSSANQRQPVMVPTSDGGEAYFESNYGTLLSRSSAYKTLGYDNNNTNNTINTTNHLHQQAAGGCSDSTISSTSLTTHANVSLASLANMNQMQLQQEQQQQQLANDEQNYHHNHRYPTQFYSSGGTPPPAQLVQLDNGQSGEQVQIVDEPVQANHLTNMTNDTTGNLSSSSLATNEFGSKQQQQASTSPTVSSNMTSQQSSTCNDVVKIDSLKNGLATHV